MSKHVESWMVCDWCGVEALEFAAARDSWVSVRQHPSPLGGDDPGSIVEELCATCGAAYRLAVDEARQRASGEVRSS